MTNSNLKGRKVISYLSNNQKLSSIAYCVVLMVLISCGGSDDGPAKADCVNGLWVQSIQSELSAWSAATQAYGTDPTTENCQKYKSTGQDYIKALDRIKACVPNQGLADFEESLEEAKTEINEIPC